jgi:hypothetical protein
MAGLFSHRFLSFVVKIGLRLPRCASARVFLLGAFLRGGNAPSSHWHNTKNLSRIRPEYIDKKYLLFRRAPWFTVGK